MKMILSDSDFEELCVQTEQEITSADAYNRIFQKIIQAFCVVFSAGALTIQPEPHIALASVGLLTATTKANILTRLAGQKNRHASVHIQPLQRQIERALRTNPNIVWRMQAREAGVHYEDISL